MSDTSNEWPKGSHFNRAMMALDAEDHFSDMYDREIDIEDGDADIEPWPTFPNGFIDVRACAEEIARGRMTVEEFQEAYEQVWGRPL